MASDAERSRNRPPVLARRPADRHYFNRIKQNSMTSKRNTVIDPRVDVANDVAAINRGEAVRQGDSYTVSGRTYVLEPSGRLSRRTGDGFYVLDRGSFHALWIYRQFGDSDRAEAILARMHNVGSDERDAALEVIRAITGKG